jgi:hypothetical protein
MESRVRGIIRRDIMPRMCLILMAIISSACTISPCGCLLSRLLQVLWERLSLLELHSGVENRAGVCDRSISNDCFSGSVGKSKQVVNEMAERTSRIIYEIGSSTMSIQFKINTISTNLRRGDKT